jgi:hypothetical protein
MSRLVGEFGDEGGEEVRGGGPGGGDLRFQLVHQGHQLIQFGHDPALFGEGWDGRYESANRFDEHVRLGGLLRSALNLSLETRRTECQGKVVRINIRL